MFKLLSRRSNARQYYWSQKLFKLGLLGGSVVAASTIGGGAVLKAAELTHSHQASQGKSNKIRGRMFFKLKLNLIP